jgi:hypothetical protein
MSEDMVNSPSHYNQSNIECIDAIRAALGEEGFIFYCRGNNIKYNWRAGHKVDTKEDLKKAAWYSRMAAGDDPRYRPSAPNLPPVHGVVWSSGADGYVPPECDTRGRDGLRTNERDDGQLTFTDADCVTDNRTVVEEIQRDADARELRRIDG